MESKVPFRWTPNQTGGYPHKTLYKRNVSFF